MTTTAVYVSNADSGDIWTLHLADATGALRPVQRTMIGGEVMPMALSPDGRRLYAARRSEPREVLSFSIDPATGQLARRGEAALPHSMAHISTDRSGRFLFSASYGGDQIAVSPIDGDGVAQPAHEVLATPPHAHAILADPGNRFVFATSLGGGVILQYRFDAQAGRLTPNAPAAFTPHADASPRHLRFGPGARHVYLLNELDASIDVLAFDAEAGTLSSVQTIGTLPAGFEGQPWAAELHLTPDGRFLYSSERGSNTLAAFAVDAASGRLALVGHTPTEAQPRGFAITPDGRYLIAAGQLSNRLSVYAIDARRGALEKRSELGIGQNPNWIETVALDG
jgi:6-phosphogluconolactonase